MASKILGAGAKLLGIGGKKKAAPAAAPAAEQKGPIIKQLGGSDATTTALRRKLIGGQVSSGLFGQSPKLGG